MAFGLRLGENCNLKSVRGSAAGVMTYDTVDLVSTPTLNSLRGSQRGPS